MEKEIHGNRNENMTCPAIQENEQRRNLQIILFKRLKIFFNKSVFGSLLFIENNKLFRRLEEKRFPGNCLHTKLTLYFVQIRPLLGDAPNGNLTVSS